MQYEKSVLLKNNKECCIRNAVGDDAQEVLDKMCRRDRIHCGH